MQITTIPFQLFAGGWGAAANESTSMVYAVGKGGLPDSVQVVDSSTDTIVSTSSTGANPENVAVDEVADRIYVTDYDDGTLTVVDGTDNTVVGTITVGHSPTSVSGLPWKGCLRRLPYQAP